MKKRITVQHVTKGDEALKGKVFKSYPAVARALAVGDSVVVAVHDASFAIGDSFMLEGYGEIERTSEDDYSCPRRLMQEW